MNTPDMRSPRVRHGVIGSAALVALILLALFYSVVAGAVDRAAIQRNAALQLEAAAHTAAAARLAVPRPVLAVQTQPMRAQQRYAPRTVAYVRSVN